MNATVNGLEMVTAAPINIELLSEDELASIEGGSMYWRAALYLIGGGAGAALIGVAIGVAVYAWTH